MDEPIANPDSEQLATAWATLLEVSKANPYAALIILNVLNTAASNGLCSCPRMPDHPHIHINISAVNGASRKQARIALKYLVNSTLITHLKTIPKHTLISLDNSPFFVIQNYLLKGRVEGRVEGRVTHSFCNDANHCNDDTCGDCGKDMHNPKGRVEGRVEGRVINIPVTIPPIFDPKGRVEGQVAHNFSTSESDCCSYSYDVNNEVMHNPKGRVEGRVAKVFAQFLPLKYSFTTLIATLWYNSFNVYNPPPIKPPPLNADHPENQPQKTDPKIDPKTDPQNAPQPQAQPQAGHQAQQPDLFLEADHPNLPSQDDLAESIYAAYPRKVGKPAALRSIKKALKRYPAQFLLEKTKAFASLWDSIPKHQRDFCPHPSTWFNQERFNDHPDSWNKPKQLQNQPYNPNQNLTDW